MNRLVPLLLAAICGMAAAYGDNFFNLDTPLYGLSEGDYEFSMNHRFYGAALKDDPLKSFLGLDDGANVRFGLRYVAMSGFDIGISHERAGHAYTLTAGWSGAIVPVDIELGASAGYTSVEYNATDGREGGLIASLCVAARLFGSRVRPVVNYAYDGYREDSGPGFGLEVGTTEKLSILGEYFPVIGDDNGNMEDCFSIGARYSTWGHQFLLGFSNSQGIGTRGQLMGAPTNDLTIALSIRRTL